MSDERVLSEHLGAEKVPRAGVLSPVLLVSKLTPPRTLLSLVPRRAVLEALRAPAPLLVVSAPAGAGKTTVLLQWSETQDRPVTWLRVDRADNDPVVLLRYLAAALGRVAAVDPEVRRLLQITVPPVGERVLPLLAHALENAAPFVLVVDDAQLLTGERCWEILSVLLDNLPAGAQIALGTREEPLLPLGRLRAEGKLVEVGMDELAFDHDEAALLWAAQGIDVDDEALDAVVKATEGWATGLYLACLTTGRHPGRDWLPEVRGDRHDIAAYLSGEVLRQAPADVQSFLCRTAILDELTAAACRDLTGRDDAGEVLRALARRHLFVSVLDEARSVFGYHPLFAELLRAELGRREPAELSALHERAARHYREQGELDWALGHELAAGDVSAAAGIVTANWRTLWDRGQAETVRRWVDSFADSQILGDPALLLTAGWVYSALADSAVSQRWTIAACRATFDDGGTPFGAASLRSAQALLSATVAPDGVTQMRKSAETAAQLEDKPGTSWYVDARVTLGTARWLAGAGRRAVHPLQVAARDGAAYNPSAELAALGTLSLIAADEGDWPAAQRWAANGTQRLAELELGSYRRMLLVLLAHARVAAHQGLREVDGLVARIDESLRRMVPHPWMAVAACVLLGEVSLETGDHAGAVRWSARAQDALHQYPDAGVFGGRADRLRKALERARGIEPFTRAEGDLLDVLPTHLTESQLAEHLCVSRNTVKTHLRGIYRKLEVNSRGAAVERARELGLLKNE